MVLGLGFLILLFAGGFAVAAGLGNGFRTDSLGTHGKTRGTIEPSPRDLLDRRLARGEIDRDQYDEIRRRLES